MICTAFQQPSTVRRAHDDASTAVEIDPDVLLTFVLLGVAFHWASFVVDASISSIERRVIRSEVPTCAPS
jgi:hypothetical protein